MICKNRNLHNPVHYLDWGELVLIVLGESGRRPVFQKCVVVEKNTHVIENLRDLIEHKVGRKVRPR